MDKAEKEYGYCCAQDLMARIPVRFPTPNARSYLTADGARVESLLLPSQVFMIAGTCFPCLDADRLFHPPLSIPPCHSYLAEHFSVRLSPDLLLFLARQSFMTSSACKVRLTALSPLRRTHY